MNNFSKKLNELLVETYRQVTKIEEQAIRQDSKLDLTISELHMLESVSKNKEGCTISFIAEDQGITLPSVTVAINKLTKKGYVEKQRAAHDGRQVLVKLTREGRKVNAGHQYFHENMVRNIIKEFDEEEQQALVKGIDKLNCFFKKKLEAVEAAEANKEKEKNEEE